ncbi:Uu.00g066730.m01.CDS01 [Anthostomella pinea]|uniref:Uu.00g066730.m01.CDS01 n=1 Tax=Anthostomella pinea TaxID=933095 RepID=A0AAI8VU07_9PEZI|nr:Uu.00g066730.m01.CDS01 [Anthostomella pinea]
MGIKGIYKEIGTGKRISLTKLAVEHLEATGRPLRLAIDISIWQFQVQAARGGSNPAIRTLFYRLLRLLSLSIQPIFVFDGPNKPVFKRNKRSGRGDGVATAMAKRLIRLFGFQVHDSPGEAEAECALLQQHGIVDAVLSEDVDTIMFGCKRTLRNWTSEGTKGSKAPTHVSMYDTEQLIKGTSGLDREGMVLVALMSGGDYLPEGIPGAGVKLACEAARAGFGTSLCRLKRSDTSEMASWREWLTYELRHNESGFFRTRHKALSVPEDFPNMDILRYYTHPVVSPAATLDRLKTQSWDRPIDILGLRDFTRETFDWNYRIGAIKFIRVLAPCLLVRKLMQRSSERNHRSENLEVIAKEESELVKSITTTRAHFSTDATPELRISFIPTNIVGYDFQEEPDEVIEFGRDGLALNSDDEVEVLAEEDGAKAGSKKPFSPTEPDLFWIPETVAKLGIPLMVENWEEAKRSKAVARPKAKAKTSKQKSKTGGMATGALDKFVKVTKSTAQRADTGKAYTPPLTSPPSPDRTRSPLGTLPTPSQSLPQLLASSQGSQKARPTARSSKLPKPKPNNSSQNASSQVQPRPGSNTNPWTLAGSQLSPRVSKSNSTRSSVKAPEAILISSSPPASPTADRRPALGRAESSYVEGNAAAFPTQPTSPQKRRSITPPRASFWDGVATAPTRRGVRDLSPTPNSSEKPRRKLARTESLPVKLTPQKLPVGPRSTRARGLARAKTVAVEALLPLDSEDDDDDDFDLPPVSSLFGRIPKGKPSSSSPSSNATTRPQPPPFSSIYSSATTTSKQRPKQQQRHNKQAALETAFGGGARMTKLYVPRKSEPGFFKEIDISVDEVEAVQVRYAQDGGGGGTGRRIGGAAVWRRSDITCIDLTGD